MNTVQGNATSDLAALGLSSAQAAQRIAEEGYNELPSSKQRSTLAIALGITREPMFLLLIVAATIYLALGDFREAAILSASVLFILAITIFQERKTERALEALRDFSSPRALVIRDGQEQRIAGREVVREDILILTEGDRVPADATVLECNDLMVDESLLTGESVPVRKAAWDGRQSPARPGGDDLPFVYSGSMLVQGRGVARVGTVGLNTEIGKIGKALQTVETDETFLQKKSAVMIRTIAAVGLSLCALGMILYGLMRGNWINGFLVGIALAMPLLPEEIPVVLTVFLALGAWRMSQKQVLTRRMPAIETLGSATVLCVDKTGTLTENQMALADVIGEDAARVSDAAALACELEPFDPMERAILAAAAPQVTAMRRAWSLERDYPMSSAFLAVCHVWRSPSGERRV